MKLKLNDLYVRLLIWRIKHLSDRNFLLILGGVIGVLSGFSAVLLKESVHFIQGILVAGLEFTYGHLLYFTYPLAGILITVLISHFFFKEQMGHGITSILYSISKNSSILAPVKIYSRMITSAITVGFGGSVGLEAPIVVTGSAIGSNIGQGMHLDFKKRSLLIGCGAAGAISAIFNSPIAGVIFSIEVILVEVTTAALTPILIASVAGALISFILLGEDVLFSFRLQDPFTAGDVPYYILLGIACGIVSLYFTKVVYKVERQIGKVQKFLPKALLGGLLLGIVIFVFPPIYGEGYNTIKIFLAGGEAEVVQDSLIFSQIENKFLLLIFLGGLVLIKPVATALTIGSGGSGGVFAPSLFMGGIVGFLFAKIINLMPYTKLLSISNFTLVGMCGVMSGVLHAPLTAIFLIAEITSGYTLFVPLMLVSAISYTTFTYFETYSFYTKHLIERGDLIQYDKDRQVLSLIPLGKLVETDLMIISPEATLGNLVDLVRTSKRNIFPVVDDDQVLVGIVTLDDIREIMFDEQSRNTLRVKELMHDPPENVSSHEKMQSVMSKFEKTGAWNLPVIDEDKYVGFVSKSRIFNAYRTKLRRQLPN